jgi:starch phosphorylase
MNGADDKEHDLRQEIDRLKADFQNHLKYSLAKYELTATDHDRYLALALSIRDRLVERWIRTSKVYHETKQKRVYYLSMEYLIGRAMGNNVINLRLDKAVTAAMEELDLDWDEIRDFEQDAGLGNGGLGRLAACFLDSLATMELPGYGYGIRYDYGIFKQTIRSGWQVEVPDNWLRHGNPWEIERPEYQFSVQFGGKLEECFGPHGKITYQWVDYDTVMGIPYDFPIAGYGNNTVNNLRLWTAKATEEFNLEFFNSGEYIKAYENKMLSENITKVLYPSDEIKQGRTLRFKQYYFFTSCTIQDIVRRFQTEHSDFKKFPEKVAIQLNDTHPALAIPELMRILVYREHLEWDLAWEICQKTFGYTNHTLMPEALEKWPIELFEKFLPIHLHIIYEINH